MSQAENATTMSRLSRRSALAGLAGAAVARVAVLSAGAGEVDPIFAVIEEYKSAVRARSAALDAEYDSDEDHDEATGEALDAEWEAFSGLFETTPTSIAGIAALLELFGTDPYDSEAEFGPGDSVLGWAYNNGPGSPSERAANQLMSTLAGTLRTMAVQAIGGQS
jgi:hypothetical protein